MLSILSPYLLFIKIAAGLALIGSILFAGHKVADHWREQGRNEIRAEHAIADKAALDDLKILNDQAVRNQADLNEARNTIIEKTKETKHEKDAYTDMRDKYLDGSRRLSIVTAASARDKAERDHNSSATVKFTETRTDILPETAGRIFSIARGNYQDVRDLNECIDLYNAARDAVNKKEQ